jgi:hypothetical protein
MKKLILLTATGFLFLSCKKEIVQNQNNKSEKNQLTKDVANQSLQAAGAIQISGVGFYATPNECDAASQGATYSVKMTGDLEGCLHVFIDEYNCSQSGTYREIGREYFVGTFKGETGTFWTSYKFEAKFEGCAADGSYLGAEIFGRCQHPIVEGSGTGVFEGVTGRMDFKDDVEVGNFPYTGHLLF